MGIITLDYFPDRFPSDQLLYRSDQKILYKNLGSLEIPSFIDIIINEDNTELLGDGSDGDVVLTSDTVLTRSMKYRSLTVAAGVSVTANSSSLVIQCLNSLVLNGTIQANNKGGQLGQSSVNLEQTVPDSYRGGRGGNGGRTILGVSTAQTPGTEGTIILGSSPVSVLTNYYNIRNWIKTPIFGYGAGSVGGGTGGDGGRGGRIDAGSPYVLGGQGGTGGNGGSGGRGSGHIVVISTDIIIGVNGKILAQGEAGGHGVAGSDGELGPNGLSHGTTLGHSSGGGGGGGSGGNGGGGGIVMVFALRYTGAAITTTNIGNVSGGAGGNGGDGGISPVSDETQYTNQTGENGEDGSDGKTGPAGIRAVSTF